MNTNNALQNQALLVWDGAASAPRKITHHVNFAFTLEVKTTLVAAAIFDVVSYDPSSANPNAHDAGTEEVVQVPATCVGADGGNGRITIPSGTVAGTVIAAAIPCRPGAFVSLKHVSGGANVRGIIVLSGPMI